jgi:hypothetical protein
MNEESTEYILPEDEYVPVPPSDEKSRVWVIASVLLLLLVITGVVFAVISMVNNPDQTETIRDIVIIFMAVESLLIGLVLIILMIQLARLTTMLQNEVKPILDSTSETLNTLRGTTNFLSDKLVNPVVKANSSIAAIMRAIELLRFGRNRKR